MCGTLTVPVAEQEKGAKEGSGAGRAGEMPGAPLEARGSTDSSSSVWRFPTSGVVIVVSHPESLGVHALSRERAELGSSDRRDGQ